jgi:glycosyltransferase involved in cell wall biosynthesis
MKLSPDIAAIIPAFNEERNITEVVARTKRLIENVIVVDDGSSDRTAQLAEKGGAIVVRNGVNLGKGESLRTGTDYVLKNLPKIRYVVAIDADLQLNPEDAPRMVAPLVSGEADVVMGMRDFSKVPFRHRLGNFVWKTAFNVLFGTNFKDTNCGYIALTVDAVRAVGGFHGGYIIEPHLLAESVKKGLRVSHVPVEVNYGKVSSVPRGIRMVLGVMVFILKAGIAYRLGGKR